MATSAAATDPSNHLMEMETSDNPNSVAESGSNNNNASATDTMDTRNATGTLDEDTSSIEALNWCEFDEEEMASAKNPEVVRNEGERMELEGDQAVPGGRSGPPLSTSLLKSIDSQMPQDDKITNIENWASDVISATEEDLLGELQTVAAEGEDASLSTSSATVYQQVPESEKGIESSDKGIRKRTSKTNIMAMSTVSSLSNTDSKGDPLSNAPVLDEGPIWGKGSKRYKFQENRRFNQKLTFGVLLSVVLAIGLGLGNLVAYNECEAEYKATVSAPATSTPPPPTVETPSDDKVHSAKVPNTPPLSTIPKEKAQGVTDELDFRQQIPQYQYGKPTDVPEEPIVSSDGPVPLESPNQQESQSGSVDKGNIPASAPVAPDEPRKSVNDKPFVDPSYASHAEALASVVKSLDQLSRKIDQFQNTTRQLGGIVMLKEEVINELRSKSNAKDVKEEKSEKLLDEQVHPDLSDEELALEEELEKEDDMVVAEELINAIEENEAYEEKQYHKEQLEEMRQVREEEDRERGLVKDETYRSMEDLIKKYIEELDELDRNFIEQERARVAEERIKLEESGEFDKPAVRSFDEYGEDEKKAILARYNQFKKEYETKHNIASSTKKLLEQTLQIEKPNEVVAENNNDIEVLSDDSEEGNFKGNQEEDVSEEIQDDDELQLENVNEELFDMDNFDAEEQKDVISSFFLENSEEQQQTETVNENVLIEPESDKQYDHISEVSNESFKKEKVQKKHDKHSPEKVRKHKDRENEEENKPYRKEKKEKHHKFSDEEENLKISFKNKRSSSEEGKSRKKWKDLSADEKRHKYAKEKDDHYNKEKSKKRPKSQKFSDKNVQSLEEERQYEEKGRWKKGKDWATDRAQLRENNRRNNHEDSNLFLAKKNKNWQLDRDKAREKFRNKNIHYDD